MYIIFHVKLIINYKRMKKKFLFTMLMGIALALIYVSCSKKSNDDDINYSIAHAQLVQDYSQYNISDIDWETVRGYQICDFKVTTKTKSQLKEITAWYTVINNFAIREMDSEDLGVVIPSVIKAAFDNTVYSNTTLWRVDEVELENNYSNSNDIKSYYEVEVENISVNNLEAKLYFSAETGELLYSKEVIDNDSNNNEDKFVVNTQLAAAVEEAFPGAIIIDAEIDDNLIEVDAIIEANEVVKEIEILFDLNYKLVSSKKETTYSYNTLPTEFNVIKEWFTNNPTIAPAPGDNIVIEVTEGDQVENNIQYYYSIEIDDYTVDLKEYEVEFFLDKNYLILSVEINDIMHNITN